MESRVRPFWDLCSDSRGNVTRVRVPVLTLRRSQSGTAFLTEEKEDVKGELDVSRLPVFMSFVDESTPTPTHTA